MLCWRLAMRCAFTAAAYGVREGLRAVPRAFLANLIAILACFRALGRIVATLGKPAQQPVWDKTAHRFPSVLPRSEEHTSELQSLMRISYAVFCLKKKKKTSKIT